MYYTFLFDLKKNVPLILHGENFMVIFTTLSVVIWFYNYTGHTEYGNNSHTIDFHAVL